MHINEKYSIIFVVMKVYNFPRFVDVIRIAEYNINMAKQLKDCERKAIRD